MYNNVNWLFAMKSSDGSLRHISIIYVFFSSSKSQYWSYLPVFVHRAIWTSICWLTFLFKKGLSVALWSLMQFILLNYYLYWHLDALRSVSVISICILHQNHVLRLFELYHSKPLTTLYQSIGSHWKTV